MIADIAKYTTDLSTESKQNTNSRPLFHKGSESIKYADFGPTAQASVDVLGMID
jgi:hypothetical protein